MVPPNAYPSKKRRREPVDVDVKLVEIYEDLTNPNDDVRLKAASALISRFTPDKSPTDDEVEKVLKRLFRGLCSGRKAARIGFSVALTELLSQLFVFARERHAKSAGSRIRVEGTVDIWEAQSTLQEKNVSGQEERDHYFGRLFGAEALIKSCVLFSPDVPDELWTRVLTALFEIPKRKPWLREECGWVVVCALREVYVKKFDDKYAKRAIELLVDNGLARTPEGVAIWLEAKDLFAFDLPANVWQYGSPLSGKERTALAKIMKESSDPEEEKDDSQEKGQEKKNVRNSSTWSPKLHFAWNAVLSRLYECDAAAKKSKSGQISFSDFWTEVVDNALFAASSSDERKYWGFLVFIHAAKMAPLVHTSAIFSKNLMRSLINQLSVQDRYLHRIATTAVKAVQSRVSAEPAFVAPALHGLMGPTGAPNFDTVTKTKTMDKLVSSASADALVGTLPFFAQMLESPGVEDVRAANGVRQQLSNLLHSMVKSHLNPSEPDPSSNRLFDEVLQLLSRFGYFVPPEGSVEPPVTEPTQDMFRNKVVSCLAILISGSKTAADAAYGVVKKINEMDEKGSWGGSVIEMPENVKEEVDKALKTAKKIAYKENPEKPSPTSSALRLIYSLVILQVYNGDADAVSMLDDLKPCYEKLTKSKKDKKKHKHGDDDDEEPDASDTLVEIILSFASKPGQLFRKTSEQVFGAFADQVTATGLESMIAVLEAKDNLEGQQEMFEPQEASDVDMEDADGASHASGSDVESVDSSVEEVSAEAENEDNDEEEEEGEDEGEEDDAELAAFDSKLAAALGHAHAPETEAKDGTDDANANANANANADDDESDSDLTDSAMEAVDAQLSRVFSARARAHQSHKSAKQSAAAARDTMLNFKNRVLDLVEIYVRRCHGSLLALDLLMPLLRLARRARARQVAGRAAAVVREYARLCRAPGEKGGGKGEKEKEKKKINLAASTSTTAATPPSLPILPADSPTLPALLSLLRDIHAETARSGSSTGGGGGSGAPPAHAVACSQASLLVVRVLVAADRARVADVVDVYAETEKRRLSERRWEVPAGLFADWNSWCVSWRERMVKGEGGGGGGGGWGEKGKVRKGER